MHFRYQKRASFRTSAQLLSKLRDETQKDAAAVAATLPPKWAEEVKKELKGQDPSKLVRFTAEGIPIKPIYTEADNPTWNPQDPALSGSSPYSILLIRFQCNTDVLTLCKSFLSC